MAHDDAAEGAGRMALRDDVREQGASREWEARMDELRADLIKSANDWEVLMATKRAKREMGKTDRGQSLKRQAGAAALVAALLVGAVPTAVQAGDVWTCTWPGFSSDHRPVLMRFRVRGDFLIEDDSLQESYRILQNNENAVIATMAIAAIPPGHSKLSILSRTFVIDKSTGELVWSNLTLGEPDSANKPVHGTCHVGHER